MRDTILKGDHPRIISAKFGWDWLSSFRGEKMCIKIKKKIDRTALRSIFFLILILFVLYFKNYKR
jgi:hypothetical protein